MRRAVLALVFAACGCDSKPTEPVGVDTGAREAVEAFFGGLADQDPRRAYEVLDAESRRRVSAERFAEQARAYYRNVGFAVQRVQVRSCEERGDEATAHVNLIGHSAGHSRRYADGTTLRRVNGRWGIVLPANFGQKAR